ncbi:MAG: glycoside hydrolase family 97 N-terminal domain-containing protein, partial [Bacteroidia bacterium]|nr:glycoside hydrolase family 97 N-terminal domain-containing protein [Bacteroidia bacterium]
MISFVNYFRFVGFLLAMASISACDNTAQLTHSASSPDGSVSVDMMLVDGGKPAYTVSKDGKTLVDTSILGFSFQGQEYLGENMTMTSGATLVVSDPWTMPWGEQREVENTYTQLTVGFSETGESGRAFDVVFRIYDDGI